MTKIKIGVFTSELKNELVKYNQKHYGRSDTAKYFDYRFVNHPYSDNPSKTAVLAFSEGSIVGQQCYLPLKFRYSGETQNGLWGIDLVLSDEFRGKGIGKMLVKENAKVRNYFSFSVSKHALELHEKFGFVVIDSFIRLVYIPSFIELFKLAFFSKKARSISFPASVETNEFLFKKTDTAPVMEKAFWNDDIIEFLRDKDFLKWRFFGDYPHFALYLNDDKSNPFYFVIKELKWRNHSFLCLVDMRVNRNDNSAILSIINACKLLVSSTGCKGIVAGSSLRDYLNCFLDYGFFEFDTRSIILTNAIINKDYPILKNKGVNVNMADSDFENVYKLEDSFLRSILKGFFRKRMKY